MEGPIANHLLHTVLPNFAFSTVLCEKHVQRTGFVLLGPGKRRYSSLETIIVVFPHGRVHSSLGI